MIIQFEVRKNGSKEVVGFGKDDNSAIKSAANNLGISVQRMEMLVKTNKYRIDRKKLK